MREVPPLFFHPSLPRSLDFSRTNEYIVATQQRLLCENIAHEPANPALSLLKLSEIWAMHGRGGHVGITIQFAI